MKIQLPKRIRVEDFEKQYQDLVSRLGYSINSFYDDITNVVNGNIDFDNMNRQLVTVDVTIDNTGAVVNTPQVKYLLRSGKVNGLIVAGAVNINAPATTPTSAPWVSYIFSNGILTINSVTGLQNNSQYRLTLELLG